MSLGRIWAEVERALGGSEKRLRVAKTLLVHGLRVARDGVYCGEVKVTITSLAGACGVDRRTVMETLKVIRENRKLREIFEGIEPAGPFLLKIARRLGYRSLVIEVYRDQPGILASVSTALAKRGINIVQVVAEDPNLIPDAKLYVIVEGDVPGDAIQEILSNPVIKRVSIS